MNLTLEALGLTQEEAQERVIEQMAKEILGSTDPDDVSNYYKKRIQERLSERIDRMITEQVRIVADAAIGPDVEKLVREFVIQETNTYGEKKGEPITLTEHVIRQVKAHLDERVDEKGRAKEQAGYGFEPKGTRLAFLVRSFLDDGIRDGVRSALSEGMGVAKEGMVRVVKETLARMQLGLSVTTDVKERQ